MPFNRLRGVSPRRHRHALVALAAVAAAAGLATPAHAATIDVSSGVLRYQAAPAETNRVSVSLSAGVLILVESGPLVPLTPGPGCTLAAPGRVTCPSAGIASLSIDAGDGADVVTLDAALPATIVDGPGDDAVTGGPSNDTLVGSPGDDTLDGGAGNDTFTDAGGPGADRLAGGAGTDTADYSGRTTGIALALDDARGDGAPGENDDVRSDVEAVTGGAGDDRLVGSSTANTLRGGAGNDVLDGGGGADTLTGNSGEDTADYSARTAPATATIDSTANDGEAGEGDNVGTDVEDILGGAGADTLSGDGDANDLAGGPGADTLNGGDGDDLLDGGTGGDTLNGGSGRDTADYSTRSAPVTVDLEQTSGAGESGENDRIGTDVESAASGAGDDVLRGDRFANTLAGGAGDDVLDGRDGADTLIGGAGTDTADYSDRDANLTVTLDGFSNDGERSEKDNVRADVENVTGGQGDDKLAGDDDANALLGGRGDDTLTGNGGPDRLDGGSGEDTLTGGAGDDALTGGDLSDTLRGGDGADALDGGTGNDELDGDGGPDTLVGATGNDDLAGGDGPDNLDGGSGNDALGGGTGPDILRGSEGADKLSGNDDPDALDGGPGDDQLWGGAASDALDGGPGNDRDWGEDGDDTVTGGDGDDQDGGGPGNDAVTDTAGSNRLQGDDGNDVLTAGDGNDVLDGGHGADALGAGGGNDAMDGGSEDDALNAGAGDDRLRGSDGRDRLAGGDGTDQLSGGDDADVLDGGPGGDDLRGDGGEDTVDYGARTEAVRVTNDGKADDGSGSEHDNVHDDIDDAIGGAGNDTLSMANAWPHRLDGGAGNDNLTGGEKADALVGGPGNDRLTGRGGRDAFDGGPGADRLSAVDGVSERLGCGTGRDVAYLDRGDRPSACEQRRVRKPKSGPAPSPPPNRVSAPRTSSALPRGVRRVASRGRFVAIPGSPGERIDRRLLRDIAFLKARYHVAITDGFALHGHEPGGEHPRGLALDLVPGPGGSWNDIDRLARWAEPRQNHPRAPFRWVGYNGDPGHGRGNHLHLSWMHAPTPRGRPARWVITLAFRRARPRSVVPSHGLVRFASISNYRLGHRPSVRTGLHALPRCQGAAQLKPTWVAAARAFGLRWQILAAITQIESNFGCNMGPSSAGAIGWTQFMPATWRVWGMDADGDHKASPYNSVDAIFSTARYLRASGAPRSYHRAIYAYNHAEWYVRGVLARARNF